MQRSMQGLGALLSATRQRFRSGGASGQPATATTASPAYELREENLGRLHRAAAHGDLAWLRRWRWWLKRVGMDKRDEQQRTPLHLACANGHEDVVRYLVQKNCQLNLADSFKRSPLMKAVECQQEKCVAILLEHGADPNLADAGGNTALHLAVLSPNTAVAGLLLEHDAKIDALNQDGYTPLGLAVSRHQKEMVEFLLNKVADRHAHDEQESGDLTDSPLREGVLPASCQKLQDLLLPSLGTDAATKKLVEHMQRLAMEYSILDATVQQQSSRTKALWRDLQASASMQKQNVLSLTSESLRSMLEKALQLRAHAKEHVDQSDREKTELLEQHTGEAQQAFKLAEWICRHAVCACKELKRNSELEKDCERTKAELHGALSNGRVYEEREMESKISLEALTKTDCSERDSEGGGLRGKVGELSRKAENESEKRMQQEAENGYLQEQLSSLGEKCEELEKSKCQLEEEVAKLNRLLETNMVDRCQTEQYKREVGDLSQQLEKESTRRTQLEAQNSCLQEQVSTMHESHEELEKRKRQLKEEVAKLKHHMATNMVDCSQIEQRKKEAEEELIQALRRQLEEDNLFRRVGDLSQQLEKESTRRTQLEAQNRYLQEQVSTMRESHGELKKRKQQLKEEVAKLKHHMATNMVDCSQIEQWKKEVEEELIQALRRQLEGDNLFRRAQAVPRDILDQVTGSLNAMRDELGNVQRQMGKMETSYQESLSKQKRLHVELGTYKTQFLREFNFRKSVENQLARANERLAEANAKLLQEQSTEVGHLGKDLTLKRRLSLGGGFQSPTRDALSSRTRVEASVVQQEPDEKTTEELEEGTDELETGSTGSSSTRSSDRTSYGIPEIELDSI